MKHSGRDLRDPRIWSRIWQDAPGIMCCCASDTQMYVCGGANNTLTTMFATADKALFTAETASAVTTANLSQGRFAPGCAANPAIAGYFCGGNTTSTAPVKTADKLTFSGDSTSAVTTAQLSQARDRLAGVSERSSKAYFAGGTTNGGGTGKVTTGDKLTFSGDSTSAVTTVNLSQARYGVVGMTEGTSKGYFGGGSTSGTGQTVVTVDKITFSTDTTAAVTTANLSTQRMDIAPGSDGSTKGYWCGGQTGAPSTRTDKLTFSTDTTVSITNATFNRYSCGCGSNGSKIFAGGGNDISGILSTIMKFDIASEAAVNISGTLTSTKQLAGGLSYQAL